MEAVRQWILLGCSGCILYGLLENLLPRRGVYPVIKAVVTLYILLILLSPAGSDTGLWPRLPQPASSQARYDGQLPQGFWRQTDAALSDTLAAALTQAGLKLQLRGVHTQADDRTVTGVQLTLFAADEGDRAGAEKLCDSLLGLEAAYIWEDS